MTAVGIALQAGDLVTSLTFKSGATAAGTPTNWWYGLYSTAATPALLAQTADQLTAAWAANTAKTVALATAYPVPASGWYYAAVMVKATTVPTLVGLTTFAGASGGVLSTDKVLAQTSGSALTGTAPATIATPDLGGHGPVLRRHLTGPVASGSRPGATTGPASRRVQQG
jgi:hypothetical protein